MRSYITTTDKIEISLESPHQTTNMRGLDLVPTFAVEIQVRGTIGGVGRTEDKVDSYFVSA